MAKRFEMLYFLVSSACEVVFSSKELRKRIKVLYPGKQIRLVYLYCSEQLKHVALSYHRLLPISPLFLANQFHLLWKVRRISLNLPIFIQPPLFGNV